MKYPRTYHLPWSPGTTSDDKIQHDLSGFENMPVIITEKMDGENTSMTKYKIWARSLDSNNHPSRNWVKGLWGEIRHDIPDGWRICGENLYARHSIEYENLPSYFMVFSIWDGETCLDWKTTIEWCSLLGLQTVPVLWSGIWNTDFIQTFHAQLNLSDQEGFVVRNAMSFQISDFQNNVVKWVRAGHVRTDKHWSNMPIVKNKLA